MRVVDPGHHYALKSLDGPSPYAVLFFVKREGSKYPGNIGSHPGVTMQEALRACRHRAKYVDHQIPCWQSKIAVYLMGLTIWLFEHRAAKRHHRQLPSFFNAIHGDTCDQCGHVGCKGECR